MSEKYNCNNPRELPPLDYLNECFILDEEKGLLIWKERPISHFPTLKGCSMWNARYPKNPAGSLKKREGYFSVQLLYKGENFKYRNHRIIYSMRNNCNLGKLQIDHIDGNTQNNVPSNLRPVSQGQNKTNRAVYKNSMTGYKGITYCKNKYHIRININKKEIHLGYCNTLKEAVKVRLAAEEEYHGKYSREYLPEQSQVIEIVTPSLHHSLTLSDKRSPGVCPA